MGAGKTTDGRKVARGLGRLFGDSVAEQVLSRVKDSTRTARKGAETFPQLTDRELQVLDLVARGQSNAAISSELYLSDKTVRNHVSNVFAKLGARDRADVVVRGREAGLGRTTD